MPDTATIFIVDDDDAVRDSMQLLLRAAGFAHVAAFDSASAFLAEASPRGGDCLIVDIRMPGIDGLELQDRLKERGIGLPIVVMTGHGDIQIAVRAMKAGAFDFLEKPFSDEVLIEAARRALAASARTRHDADESAKTKARYDTLTERERDVLQAMVAGHPSKVIAQLLGISPRTVEIHRARVMEKMQARSLSALVRAILESGLGKS